MKCCRCCFSGETAILAHDAQFYTEYNQKRCHFLITFPGVSKNHFDISCLGYLTSAVTFLKQWMLTKGRFGDMSKAVCLHC